METHRITNSLDPDSNKGHTSQLQSGVNLIDRYLIQGVIGVGGMGAVYRARDLHFPNVTKVVAVKEMVNQAPDPLVRRTIVQNFEREANLLATLDHRAIPRIYDYFTINERSYLVLEFVNGKDLEALLSSTDEFLSEDRVVMWAMELCDVLTYLHTHQPEPIIFRDMKPSNVMVNPQGHVVLVDFGIAKHFQVGQKGTMIGTEGYSPPEQYRGEATPLADIYALGATLHHLLSRRDPRLEPPFSFAERPLRKINPDITPDLEAVVYTALQYNPGERFPSAADMKEALMGVARKTGMLPNITSAPGQKSYAGGVKPVWTFQCEDEIRGPALYFDKSVYVGAYDNNLYALNAATGEFQWKYATDDGIVSRPVLFENNIVIGSKDRRVHVIGARTGRVNWTYFTDGPIYSSAAIAEGHIFIGSDDGSLHAINGLTGRLSRKIDCGAPVRSTPLVVGDLVYVGCDSGEVLCLSFTGNIKWRFKARRGVTSSPTISKGVVYFGSLDSTLYALDAKSGWVIWRFRLGKATISTPYLADNLLFIGAADGVIYCVDSASAKEIWRFNTENQISSSPIVYKDSLYCGSADGYVYCLEYRTGRLRWKFKTQGPVTAPPIAQDDVIYIGSLDHTLYALMA